MEYYSSVDCGLLEKEFKNSNTLMKYLCSCGNESVSTFGNFYHKGVRCYECGIKKLSGENSSQWNFDKTNEERIKGRNYLEYKKWRIKIFERDNYSCHVCGLSHTELNAHHLDDYANHLKQRLDMDNGVTLCKSCHKNFHDVYGRRTVNTAIQFESFLMEYSI